MKKTLPALPLVFAACFAAVAQAEPTDLGGGFSLSGNAAIVSDYRFRGYSQTDFRPAAQLGIDLTHSSGFYLGNWNSNVSSFVYTDGNLEMDFYGGWKGDVGGGLTLDAGCCTTTTGFQLAQGRQLQQHRSLPGRDLRQLHAEVLLHARRLLQHARQQGHLVPGRHRQFRPGRRLGPGRAPGLSEAQEPDQHEWRFHQPLRGLQAGRDQDLKGWVLGLAAVGATKDNWLPTKYGHPSGRLGRCSRWRAASEGPKAAGGAPRPDAGRRRSRAGRLRRSRRSLYNARLHVILDRARCLTF